MTPTLAVPVAVRPAARRLCRPRRSRRQPRRPPNPNDTCLACHGDKDAKSAAGKSIAVDGAKFAQSVHGAATLKCTDCHAGIAADKIPHGDKLQPVQCANCHDKAVKEYAGTSHSVSRKAGNAAAATCTDCHGTHDIRPSKDPASRTNHANLAGHLPALPRRRGEW